MCGITGLFRHTATARSARGPIGPRQLDRMRDSLTHRGPDDAGSFISPSGTLGLAMRRLAVIAPENGHQPIFNEDGRLALVCNGEIYNYRELRAGLVAKGHHFRTASDAEVIVHLYEEYGSGFVPRLRGMFAFALWDSANERLLLARDRIGIKPLYVANVDGTLYFGSELKALLLSGELPRQLNHQALHYYLSLNYLPAPFTLFDGIEQLEPGELVICEPGQLTRQSYWELRYDTVLDWSEARWIREMRDKLSECVSGHLVADVPFGAFLSGGVDSAAVVGLMSRMLREPTQTFTIGFAEGSYSEASQARRLATHFGCIHRETQVRPAVVDLLDRLIWHADDPLADSSMLPVFLLAKHAREHVTMVLTGDGGDEVFAGYETYTAHFVRELYRRVPRWLRQNVVRRLVAALPVSLTKVSFDYKAKRFVEGAELDAEEAHFWWRAIFSEAEKLDLYTPEHRGQAALEPAAALFRRSFAASATDDPLARMLYVDTRLYLPADMLVKVDRMTMAHGLEARVPLLDHELVELAARAPSRLKLRGQRKKHLLKEAVRHLVPKATLQRKKAGFNVPVNVWLSGELATFAAQTLAPERLNAAGVFRPEAVGRFLDEHRRRIRDHSYRLWGLLCFQLWHERFLGESMPCAPALDAPR